MKNSVSSFVDYELGKRFLASMNLLHKPVVLDPLLLAAIPIYIISTEHEKLRTPVRAARNSKRVEIEILYGWLEVSSFLPRETMFLAILRLSMRSTLSFVVFAYILLEPNKLNSARCLLFRFQILKSSHYR